MGCCSTGSVTPNSMESRKFSMAMLHGVPESNGRKTLAEEPTALSNCGSVNK